MSITCSHIAVTLQDITGHQYAHFQNSIAKLHVICHILRMDTRIWLYSKAKCTLQPSTLTHLLDVACCLLMLLAFNQTDAACLLSWSSSWIQILHPQTNDVPTLGISCIHCRSWAFHLHVHCLHILSASDQLGQGEVQVTIVLLCVLCKVEFKLNT
jgi:hypothetical protein